MASLYLLGVDIGGTKCAVSVGVANDENHPDITIIGRRQIVTSAVPNETIGRLLAEARELLGENGIDSVAAIGISCGSPLDSRRGLILAPSNLPTWKDVDITTPFREAFGAPAVLQNDANACAMAEWKWGAGRGVSNMIFLTFGTGMGAGLILDGRLYSGASDMAGEIGHVRVAEDGPEGYGKSGSFEGFCSGGGIARLGRLVAERWLKQGVRPGFCPDETQLPHLTAKRIGEAAEAGDPYALLVWEEVARRLGAGLAILVDVLNPERIVIGSIYVRQQSLLEQTMMSVLERESLAYSLTACEIVPAGLGESVGDYAALSLAMNAVEEERGTNG